MALLGLFLVPSPPVHNGEGRQAMGDLGLKKSPYPLAILIKIKFYLTPTPPKIKILSYDFKDPRNFKFLLEENFALKNLSLNNLTLHTINILKYI